MRRWIAAALLFVCIGGCASSTISRMPSPREMTLDEKIGQLFVYAGHGVFMNEQSQSYSALLHQVRDQHVGGLLWFVSNVYETAFLTRRLQQTAKIPLLVSADLEAGIGMRFEDTTFWPWNMAIAATGDPSLAEKAGRMVAREALELGINHIFAPVADVNNDPDNPVINVRSFGEDPNEVAKYVAAFVRGVQAEGVLATAKHFPGHGDTHTDSHRSLPILTVTRERMNEIELIPFRAAIAAGVDSIMIAHLAMPELDDTPLPGKRKRPKDSPYGHDASEITEDATIPASLSRKIVNDLLRKEMGYDGLVVTDALDMGGVIDHYEPGEAAVLAIEAGADQVVKSENTDAAIAGMKEAVRSGRLTEKRIDESVVRILRAKSRVKTPSPDLDRIFSSLDRPDHRAVAEQIAARAITLVREEAQALPVNRGAKMVELVVGDFAEAIPPVAALDRELRSRMHQAPERFLLDRNSDESDGAKVVEAAADAGLVLVAFTVRTRSGEGKVGVPDVARDVLEKLDSMGKPMIAVSFGNPYVLREVPFIRTYLAAYGIQPVMQVAAVRALFGETPITGRLPVTIPGLHPRGHGVEKKASRPPHVLRDRIEISEMRPLRPGN